MYFLQFQRDFIPQAELEEAFIYIIHKPIDFSIDFSYRLKGFYGHMVIGLKQVRVSIARSRKSTFWPYFAYVHELMSKIVATVSLLSNDETFHYIKSCISVLTRFTPGVR